MISKYPYTDRVTLDPDGVYRWRGRFSRSQQMKVVKITLGVCGGTCLLLIVMGLAHDPSLSAMAPILLSSLGVMAVAGLVCLLFYGGHREQYQPYEMTEERVRYVGSGKSDALFYFKNMRRVRIRADEGLIELRTAMMTAPVFVPREDLGFVQNYILQHVSGNADIVYE